MIQTNHLIDKSGQNELVIISQILSAYLVPDTASETRLKAVNKTKDPCVCGAIRAPVPRAGARQ